MHLYMNPLKSKLIFLIYFLTFLVFQTLQGHSVWQENQIDFNSMKVVWRRGNRFLHDKNRCLNIVILNQTLETEVEEHLKNRSIRLQLIKMKMNTEFVAMKMKLSVKFEIQLNVKLMSIDLSMRKKWLLLQWWPLDI